MGDLPSKDSHSVSDFSLTWLSDIASKWLCYNNTGRASVLINGPAVVTASSQTHLQGLTAPTG